MTPRHGGHWEAALAAATADAERARERCAAAEKAAADAVKQSDASFSLATEVQRLRSENAMLAERIATLTQVR